MKLTVFTPTYNRGYIIENLYRSLQRQTFRDFEWIVIDDGSTDNTEELFSLWTNEDEFFNIIYRKVQNGGKHRAINKGVQMANGELFFIVDSDDYLTDDSLEKIVEIESTIPMSEKENFAGVCGLKAYSVDSLVGSTFDGDVLDITSLESDKYGIGGDKAEVFYTNLLKQYPFPEINGENFITEAVVWNKIAYDGYKLRFFNESVYICDYLPDGLTNQGDALFHKSPIGWGIYVYQSILFGEIPRYQIRDKVLEYYRCCKKEIGIKKICSVLHIKPSLIIFANFTYRLSEKVRITINKYISKSIVNK